MNRLEEINKKLTNIMDYYYSSVDGVSIQEIMQFNKILIDTEHKIIQHFLLNNLTGKRSLKRLRDLVNRLININEKGTTFEEKIDALDGLLRDYGIII